MHAVMVKVKDEHIKLAQDIFIDGNDFDDEERIPFIKNFTTCDLLAVPGSGKTTALMAKLYCIAQNMPFVDGSGILVLAHTNQAVYEIEKKLKKDCHQLFEYPNFIGTVQSFTNRFLANQACFEKYGSYIRKNEDDIPSDKLISLSKKLPFKNTLYGNFFNQIYSREALISTNLLINELHIEKKEALEIIKNLKSINILTNKNVLIYKKCKDIAHNDQISEALKSIIVSVNKKALDSVNLEKHSRGLIYRLNFLEEKFIYENTSLGFNTDSGKILLELFEILYREGSLRYKDSFSFAEWYIHKNPQIKEILQLRFKYVFIDEMQDLERYQIDLIDSIFFSESSNTVIQRIGDINQSIYSSGKIIKDNCDWIPRNPIYLTGSNRLTEEIANIVNYYTLDPHTDKDGTKKFVVNGLAKLNTPIKPHLIIFNNESKDKLEDRFAQLIKDFKLNETSSASKNGYHIISWSTEWNNDEQNIGNEKIRLKDIFPNYSKETKQKKEDFDSLYKHLTLFDREKLTMEAIRKSILNAFSRILRLEGIYIDFEKKRYFRKSNIIDFMKSQGDEYYNRFKSNLYLWCFKIVSNNDIDLVYQEIKKFIESEFIKLNWDNFDTSKSRSILKSKEFIETKHVIGQGDYLVKSNKNSINEFNLSSIHAVKGQTHCATMYIESSYHEYETQRLKVASKLATKTKKEELLPNPLFNEFHSYRVGKDSRAKQALKMMYVGFSRPTHLLCFAVLKENIKNDIDKIKEAGWVIIDDLIDIDRI
ncbi:hypothetical protein B0A67_00340 [Flavobacterium aquidurense]|nr:hypothetical protein B0A67_00340 [Flavobacterium aquidurense]SHF91156.1 UvrD/REP helicase N-terminal domain-containing protein [Flavobacterium frigidimaris]